MFVDILIKTAIVFIIVFIIQRIWFFFTKARCKSKVCLVGKIALVTGGSSGIGYAVVLDLASRGCKVIIADKNVNETIKDAIIKETHNPNIVMKYVDLASFKSIRELAADLNSSEKVIDILINNAGIGRDLGMSEDGLNIVMQVNYYSGFLLTHLLVDLVKNSSSGRIIFTTSGFSFFHTMSMERVLPEKIEETNSLFYYSDSKFLQVVTADMFAEKLNKFNISVNTFHPYVVKSKIFLSVIQKGHLLEHLLYYLSILLVSIFGQSAEDGAQTCIYLACANEVKDLRGKLFGATVMNSKPRCSGDTKLCEEIWKTTEVAVKLRDVEKI